MLQEKSCFSFSVINPLANSMLYLWFTRLHLAVPNIHACRNDAVKLRWVIIYIYIYI